jgi:hypothetical protein
VAFNRGKSWREKWIELHFWQNHPNFSDLCLYSQRISKRKKRKLSDTFCRMFRKYCLVEHLIDKIDILHLNLYLTKLLLIMIIFISQIQYGKSCLITYKWKELLCNIGMGTWFSSWNLRINDIWIGTRLEICRTFRARTLQKNSQVCQK